MEEESVHNSIYKASRTIKKRENTVYNALRSIYEDSIFVGEISQLWPELPLLANLRCGLWYSPRFHEICYFKSTDGHCNNWSFNTSRLNLHVALLAGAKEPNKYMKWFGFGGSKPASSSCQEDPRKIMVKNNGVLARAIAGGTGQIVKGIFMCSNAYTNLVQKGGELIQTRAAEKPNSNMKVTFVQTKSKNSAAKKNSINQSIKRVRNLSSMTENMSKSMLNGVGIATWSVMKPLVYSKQVRAFFTKMPGEVLLASLDAVEKILAAAKAAEKQALHATSGAAGRMVSNRFGEDAGEATEDVLAIAGHVAGTVWNVFKIRRTK